MAKMLTIRDAERAAARDTDRIILREVWKAIVKGGSVTMTGWDCDATHLEKLDVPVVAVRAALAANLQSQIDAIGNEIRQLGIEPTPIDLLRVRVGPHVVAAPSDDAVEARSGWVSNGIDQDKHTPRPR